jgi:transcriptional regulator with XRE-family HTH domain
MTDYNSALYKIVGERIRQFRIDHRLSQEQLSQKTQLVGGELGSISRTSISNIEVGRHQPPLHVLLTLSKALHTEVHCLLPTDSQVQEYLDEEVLNPPPSGSDQEIFELLQRKNLEQKSTRTLHSIFKSL